MPDAVRTVRPRRLAWTCTGRVRPSAGYRGAVTAWHGDELDFAAYLERIGFDGERVPTVQTLEVDPSARVAATNPLLRSFVVEEGAECVRQREDGTVVGTPMPQHSLPVGRTCDF